MSTADYVSRSSLLVQDDINVIAAAHEAWVTHRNGGKRAMLQEKQLASLSFAGRTMQDADFTAAILSHCKMMRGNFERAVLYCANMSFVDARMANMKGADLRGAALQGANLAGAVLDGADFRAARLARVDRNGNLQFVKFDDAEAASLEGSSLNGANMEGAIAGSVNFSNCSLKGASFKNANLKGANFAGALLNNAKFAGAKMADVKLDGAVLLGINLGELPVSRDALKNCLTDSTPEAMARGPSLRESIEAHARWVQTAGKEGRGAVLDGADLRVVADGLHGRKLSALSAKNSLALAVNFSGSELQGANFDGSDLREANFEGCDLRGASFCNTNLGWAKFGRARLEAMPLIGGNRLSTAFEGARLFGADFSGAITTPAAGAPAA